MSQIKQLFCSEIKRDGRPCFNFVCLKCMQNPDNPCHSWHGGRVGGNTYCAKHYDRALIREARRSIENTTGAPMSGYTDTSTRYLKIEFHDGIVTVWAEDVVDGKYHGVTIAPDELVSADACARQLLGVKAGEMLRIHKLGRFQYQRMQPGVEVR